MASVKWGEMQDEIIDWLDSYDFRFGGKMNKRLIDWANEAIIEICMELDVRQHLETSSVVMTTSDKYITLPDTILKMSKRFTKCRVDDEWVDILTKEELDLYDPNHDETTSNDEPTCIAIEGRTLYIYPLWAGTLILQDYFKRPTKMTTRSSSPDMPDDNDMLLKDLIIAGVLRKGFLWLQDLDMVKFYRDSEFPRLLNLYETTLSKSNSEQVIEHNYY